MAKPAKWPSTMLSDIPYVVQRVHQQPATSSFQQQFNLRRRPCLTTQQNTFEQVETTFASGLNKLGTYYKETHLSPNPAQTQLTAFHLKNRQADRKLKVTWNGTKLDHTNSPVYLGITLDRSLTYRNHCLKTGAKLSSRNNLLRKLTGTNWGACPTPRGWRQYHYVSPWRSSAVLSGPVPHIASS